MSFLRHREIYQVLESCSPDELLSERARPSGHALTHRLDESPVGYSWRGALQQSPRPLHQPLPTLQQCRGELQESIRWNMDPTLTRCLTLGAHLSSYSAYTGEGDRLSGQSHQRSWWMVHTQPTPGKATGFPAIPPTQLVGFGTGRASVLFRLSMNNPPTALVGFDVGAVFSALRQTHD